MVEILIGVIVMVLFGAFLFIVALYPVVFLVVLFIAIAYVIGVALKKVWEDFKC